MPAPPQGFLPVGRHLASIKRVIATYDYAHALCGKSLFVNGVRPVECAVWSLARQNLLLEEGKTRTKILQAPSPKT